MSTEGEIKVEDDGGDTGGVNEQRGEKSMMFQHPVFIYLVY